MTKDELFELLKENIELEIDTHNYGTADKHVDITILFGGKEVTRKCFIVYERR